MIDLEVFGMEAIMPKSGIGCDMGDRLGSFGMEAVSPKLGTGCNMGDRLGSFGDGSC